MQASIVGDITRSVPHIYATLDNCQVDHQFSTINIEGKLKDVPISILIDLRASYSYINSNLVERCKLMTRKLSKPRMV